ncbi:MAG: sigma-70 family RNA polymerase sigma factor [Gammaproteobacteria bacterium]|nr:sigma-70 family RNA polymerase sigma factor [Gammaproteobacteria bacterium]
MMHLTMEQMNDNSAVSPTLNREHFVKQIEAHLDQLYGSALRLTRNSSDAEDLVADTVTKAWICIDSLQDLDRFKPWLLRIMTNHFISERRKASNRAIHESYVEESESDDEPFSLFERLHQPFLLWWSNPEQEFLNQLLKEDIETALNDLAEQFRVVVILADMEGLSYQEISEVLDLPVGTVRSRLSRGRSALQKALWQHAQEPKNSPSGE